VFVDDDIAKIYFFIYLPKQYLSDNGRTVSGLGFGNSTVATMSIPLTSHLRATCHLKAVY
jgi:hypothetical protein